MRLIDADALIGSLHDHAFLEGDDRSIVYNVIQKQPTVGGWISVKDRLPEKNGLYLCLTMVNNIKLYYQINLWGEKRWFWGHDVRYWMPLPEQPEELKHEL